MKRQYIILTHLQYIRLLFGLLMLCLANTVVFAAADCQPNPSANPDTIICDGDDTNGIIGGAGGDSISINRGATVTGPIFGDGILTGTGGDDTIINNGTTMATGTRTGSNGDVEGDVVGSGKGGNDTLVNNGAVANDMDGDTVVRGNGGNDTLINNGTIGDDMDGDNVGNSGGDDLIINNGTVAGDIQGDDNNNGANSVGGADIIVINGTVEGSVATDVGVENGGDDMVILQNGAKGGADNALYLSGDDGDDTLVFNFVVADQETMDDLSKQIASADPSGGLVTFNDQIFEWENFEQLESELVVKGETGAFIIASANQSRAVMDPTTSAAVYCVAGNLIAVGLDSANRAEWLFTINGADLKAGLAKAASSKSNVTLAQVDGQTLSALPSNELSLADASGRYELTVSPSESNEGC